MLYWRLDIDTLEYGTRRRDSYELKLKTRLKYKMKISKQRNRRGHSDGRI